MREWPFERRLVDQSIADDSWINPCHFGGKKREHHGNWNFLFGLWSNFECVMDDSCPEPMTIPCIQGVGHDDPTDGLLFVLVIQRCVIHVAEPIHNGLVFWFHVAEPFNSGGGSFLHVLFHGLDSFIIANEL